MSTRPIEFTGSHEVQAGVKTLSHMNDIDEACPSHLEKGPTLLERSV